MFRLWVKEWDQQHLVRDVVIENGEHDTRTHKVLGGLEDACVQLDIAVPIWLDSSIKDFKKYAKCRFTRDAFIEDIEFDYLEIQVLEEDEFWM